MRHATLAVLSVSLLLLPAAAGAQETELRSVPPPDVPGAKKQLLLIDQVLDAAATAAGDLKRHAALYAGLKADLADRKRRLAAEHGGAVPEAYSGLIAIKNARIARQYSVCRAQNEALLPLLERARALIHTFEPQNQLGLAARRQRLARLIEFSKSLAP